MREIKFRAWDKRIKKMCHVLAVDFLNRVVSTDVGFGTIDGDIELMQFTGIRDKNGVEIFDGDILAFYFDKDRMLQIKKVVWNELDASFFGVDTEDGGKRSRLAFSLESSFKVEVIGNIYENPELLESAK